MLFRSRSGLRPKLLSATDVIDVRMSDHDHLYGELIPFDDREDFGNVGARIDDDRLAADFISDHRTVAPQWADWQNFVDHLDNGDR